ncbi:hypothetical protein EYW49_19100 [Siculibacillus lacustris]|uniref:Uncharacterized protein n=1 Tax=Siculibacillus lacustris TaxID=1549641 RepID=A0A4Q9VI47_9HYPH|nr:hypothetical protein [Siculibacillus lacustris]TBW33965.1 hypothetical protein EYW49_19100 [Siculibacillus lacustris]
MRGRAPRLDDGDTSLPVAGGLARRFRAWRGASGRRYVFTRIEGRDLPQGDLDDAVVAVRCGSMVPATFAEARDLTPATRAGDCEIFAHYLAPTAADRLAVLADLDRATAFFGGSLLPD